MPRNQSRTITVLVGLLTGVTTGPLAAQAAWLQRPTERLAPSPTNPTPTAPAPTAIRWYHAGIALGVIGLASLADEAIKDQVQSHRTGTKDDVADVFRPMGEPVVFATAALGTVAVGLISGRKPVLKAGERITFSLLTAAVVTSLLKQAVGRERPTNTDDAYQFDPFSGADSWPSGHTTMAFALAASAGDEIGSMPVSIALYGAATMTGWSRMNDNRHWLSDVLAGAAIGVTSAKLMNGNWKVFGIGQPRFLVSPESVAVGLSW